MDEEFWAQNEIAVTSSIYPSTFTGYFSPKTKANQYIAPEHAVGNYDANFFHDDDLPMGPGLADDDDDDFAEAREMLSPDLNDPSAENVPFDPNGNSLIITAENHNVEFGSQLVTANRRVRPEYVQYARVAKKVDVRRLKESLWKRMEFESIDLVCHLQVYPIYISYSGASTII